MTGFEPDVVERLIAEEQARFLAGHPRSAEMFAAGRQSFLYGTPMHWMRRWAGGFPPYVERAEGTRLWDVDGNEYVDFCLGDSGAMCGHGNPDIADAVRHQMLNGATMMLPTEDSLWLGAELQRRFGLPYWNLNVSATQANRDVVRISRMITGRDKVLVFNGCYHGHSDSLLVKAGSGLLTLGIPNSPGVPAAIAANTLTLPFNDVEALDAVFEEYPEQIAAVIVEPVAGNMGCIPPVPGYLEGLRAATQKHGAVLIFDEVMTGFRVARGGAQERFAVTPDLTTLGKVVGGGLPVGAFGGRAEIMSHIAPEGPVYQAGTLSGNPLAVAAGLTMLNHLHDDLYDRIAAITEQLIEGLAERARAHGHAVATNHVCGMFGMFFDIDKAEHFDHVANSNVDKFNRFFHLMLDRGVYLAPSAFETGFISAAHGNDVIQQTLDAADQSFAELGQA